MTAGIYAQRAGLKAVILEGHFPGGKLANTAEVGNWPGIPEIGGAELATKMYEHCSALEIELKFDAATGLEDHGNYKTVHTNSGEINTKTVIIASGTRERKLNIPGEDTYASRGISYCAVCDGALFRGEKTIVIGGGNSAYEEADYMTRFASDVTLVLRRDVPRADQINVDAVARNPKVNVVYNYTPTAFLGNDDHLTGVEFAHSKTGEKRIIEGRVVFPMVGLLANTDFVGELPILNDEKFIITGTDMSTSIPGIYAAGDVRDTVLRQIVTAASDGSIAAQSIVKYLQTLES